MRDQSFIKMNSPLGIWFICLKTGSKNSYTLSNSNLCFSTKHEKQIHVRVKTYSIVILSYEYTPMMLERAFPQPRHWSLSGDR